METGKVRKVYYGWSLIVLTGLLTVCEARDPEELVRKVGVNNPWSEQIVQSCEGDQAVCRAKKVLFRVTRPEALKIELFLERSCGLMSVQLEVFDDEGKRVSNFQTQRNYQGKQYSFSTGHLAVQRVYTLFLTGHGGSECPEGYLPGWSGSLTLVQPKKWCPSDFNHEMDYSKEITWDIKEEQQQ